MTTTYGANLKRLRKRAGLTLEQLAGRLQLQRPGPLSTIETGTSVPKPSTIQKHAEALACTPADLLAGVVTDYDALRGQSAPLAPAAHEPEPLPTYVEAVAAAFLDVPLGRRPVAAQTAVAAIHGYRRIPSGARSTAPTLAKRTNQARARRR